MLLKRLLLVEEGRFFEEGRFRDKDFFFVDKRLLDYDLFRDKDFFFVKDFDRFLDVLYLFRVEGFEVLILFL